MLAAAQAQSGTTIDEVTRLMNSAAEAPRAAAEVIGALRHELSASIARDNEMLAERSRIMQTLGRCSTRSITPPASKVPPSMRWSRPPPRCCNRPANVSMRESTAKRHA